MDYEAPDPDYDPQSQRPNDLIDDLLHADSWHSGATGKMKTAWEKRAKAIRNEILYRMQAK